MSQTSATIPPVLAGHKRKLDEQSADVDPSYLSTPIWHGMSIILRLLFVLVGCVFLFAGNMVIAHMVIPSLVTTGHISQRFSRYRPLFYLGALAGAAGVITTLVVLTDVTRVIEDLYPRWWI